MSSVAAFNRRSLSKAQSSAVTSIRKQIEFYDKGKKEGGSWTIYTEPSTGQAKYVELRKYIDSGLVLRWKIGRDGEVLERITSHAIRGKTMLGKL